MEEIYGDVVAHTILLRILVSKAQLENQHFRGDAQKAFDEFLGLVALEPINPIYVEARKKFIAILNTRTDLLSDKFNEDRPLTLRRRFLLWLIRG
jgi:hypothetical protein